MSKVIVHRNAAKYLQRLARETKERIKAELKQLEQDCYRQLKMNPERSLLRTR
jgi:mRNA-degrading endonuclease RelE of RelBE toxin-antitoxin system